MENQNNRVFKLLVFGYSVVGVSSLITRYTEDIFSERHIHYTGHHFKLKQIMIDKEMIRLQIWDKEAVILYRNPFVHCRGVDAIIFVYDITQRRSFEQVCIYYEMIKKHGKDSVIVKLVGNKCDKEEIRQVSFEEGQNLANSFGISFMETSCKTNKNVNELLMNIAWELHYQQQSISVEKYERDKEVNKEEKKQISKCILV